MLPFYFLHPFSLSLLHILYLFPTSSFHPFFCQIYLCVFMQALSFLPCFLAGVSFISLPSLATFLPPFLLISSLKFSISFPNFCFLRYICHSFLTLSLSPSILFFPTLFPLSFFDSLTVFFPLYTLISFLVTFIHFLPPSFLFPCLAYLPSSPCFLFPSLLS